MPVDIKNIDWHRIINHQQTIQPYLDQLNNQLKQASDQNLDQILQTIFDLKMVNLLTTIDQLPHTVIDPIIARDQNHRSITKELIKQPLLPTDYNQKLVLAIHQIVMNWPKNLGLPQKKRIQNVKAMQWNYWSLNNSYLDLKQQFQKLYPKPAQDWPAFLFTYPVKNYYQNAQTKEIIDHFTPTLMWKQLRQYQECLYRHLYYYWWHHSITQPNADAVKQVKTDHQLSYLFEPAPKLTWWQKMIKPIQRRIHRAQKKHYDKVRFKF